MKEYVELKDGIEFKNLLSGPAQIGRILNYIIYAGEHSLKHQPGNRNDNWENNIGNAWCVEFMIGLELVELGDKIKDSNIYNINLTMYGKKMYNILIENAILPNLSQSSSSIKVLDELKEHKALNVINVFEETFRNSIIFKDLCVFLDISNISSDIISLNSADFKEDIFRELKKYYTGEDYIRQGFGTSTAGNRVASLVQLLEFLNYVKSESGNLYFNIKAFKDGVFDSNYQLDISDEHFIEEINKEEKIIERLVDEFGLSGNHMVTSTVRLSQAQLIFKERLKKEHGSKCWLCGIENEQLLVASHIKDSAKCDIYGKTDNNNGLLLCPIHDKLFDLSLITFDFQSGKIKISNKLSKKDIELCNISENIMLPESLMTIERSQYLIWHNNEFYSEED